MNGEGVLVRAAQLYHKNFEVATTPPHPPTRKFIAQLSHLCFLPSRGTYSNAFHIGAIYFYNKHRICECERQRVLKGFGDMIMSFFGGFGVMIPRSCFK